MERRRAKRYLAKQDINATFSYTFRDKLLKAKSVEIHDISAHGCCFNAKEIVGLYSGKEGTLSLKSKSSTVEFDAKVVRTMKDGIAVSYEPYSEIKVYCDKEKPYNLSKKAHQNKTVFSNLSNESDSLEIQRLVKPLINYSKQTGELVEIPTKGQITRGAGFAFTSFSLMYYLGIDGKYFLDAADLSELSLYSIFLVLSSMAVHNLLSICGKKKLKTIIAGIISGITAGSGIGGIIAGIAFGLIADIATLGGFSLAGGCIGYLLTRRGKKRHASPCGMWLPCDTWICPKCWKLIKPSMAWKDKEVWNILDVCDYLYTSGFEMNTIEALAFLDFSKLLHLGTRFSDSSFLWKESDVRKKVKDEFLLRKFNKLWLTFLKKPHNLELISKKLDTKDFHIEMKNFFERWKKFLVNEGY